MFKIFHRKTVINLAFWFFTFVNIGESQAFLGNAPVSPLQASTEQAYEVITPASSMVDFINQANAEGAKGYWYVNDYCFGPCGSFSLYAKNNSSNATFSYLALTPASSVVDFITQANAQGATGYRYLGDYSFGTDLASVYIKDNSKNAGFDYIATTPAASSEDFISQANAQGAKGYSYNLDLLFLANLDSAAIYVKDHSSNASFSYHALSPASSTIDFITQANAEGESGYGYYTNLSFDSPAQNTNVAIFVKDSSRASKFSYESLVSANSAANFISQASAEAVNGYGYYVDLAFSNTSGSIYVRNSESNTGSAMLTTINCLFNWAELKYPKLFNPSSQNTQQALGYDYRYYSGSNTYLGVFQNTNIHVLQANVSKNIIDVGSIEQFKVLSGCQ